MIQQIFNPEFLLLQAMPTLVLALGLTALNITFLNARRVRASATARRS